MSDEQFFKKLPGSDANDVILLMLTDTSDVHPDANCPPILVTAESMDKSNEIMEVHPIAKWGPIDVTSIIPLRSKSTNDVQPDTKCEPTSVMDGSGNGNVLRAAHPEAKWEPMDRSLT